MCVNFTRWLCILFLTSFTCFLSHFRSNQRYLGSTDPSFRARSFNFYCYFAIFFNLFLFLKKEYGQWITPISLKDRQWILCVLIFGTKSHTLSLHHFILFSLRSQFLPYFLPKNFKGKRTLDSLGAASPCHSDGGESHH